MEPGLYQIEGNDGLSFYEVVKRLEQKYHKNWNVTAIKKPVRDNRLIDERINPNKVSEKF